jgi:hypothetical protein
MIAGLRNFRNIIAQNDRDALEAVLDEVSKEFENWINRRHNNRWDDERIDKNMPTMGSLVNSMVGTFVAGRWRRSRGGDEEVQK